MPHLPEAPDVARARNIKPGFFKNERLAEVGMETRLLFIGLWTLADREGRLEDRPVRIKMELFPADNVQVKRCLTELHDRGFIFRYGQDGFDYIQVVEWTKHQVPHFKEKESVIPSPETLGLDRFQWARNPAKEADECVVSPGLALGLPPMQKGVSPADTLIPDSLIPDSKDYRSNPGTKPKTRPAPKSGPDGFENFWKLYPRKVKRKDAEKAWIKLTQDDADECIRVLPAHARHWAVHSSEAKYIPHASSWLNGQRWMDDLTTRLGFVQAAPQRAESRQSRQLRALEETANDPRYQQTADRQLGRSAQARSPAPDYLELAMDTGPGDPFGHDDGVG